MLVNEVVEVQPSNVVIDRNMLVSLNKGVLVELVGDYVKTLFVVKS